jgi:hypothetical protein
VKVLWAIYAVGALVAFWRTDASWPTRLALAALWPVGPLAFLVVVAILVAASLIAFPLVAGLVAAVGVVAAWFLMN